MTGGWRCLRSLEFGLMKFDEVLFSCLFYVYCSSCHILHTLMIPLRQFYWFICLCILGRTAIGLLPCLLAYLSLYQIKAYTLNKKLVQSTEYDIAVLQGSLLLAVALLFNPKAIILMILINTGTSIEGLVDTLLALGPANPRRLAIAPHTDHLLRHRKLCINSGRKGVDQLWP